MNLCLHNEFLGQCQQQLFECENSPIVQLSYLPTRNCLYQDRYTWLPSCLNWIDNSNGILDNGLCSRALNNIFLCWVFKRFILFDWASSRSIQYHSMRIIFVFFWNAIQFVSSPCIFNQWYQFYDYFKSIYCSIQAATVKTTNRFIQHFGAIECHFCPPIHTKIRNKICVRAL